MSKDFWRDFCLADVLGNLEIGFVNVDAEGKGRQNFASASSKREKNWMVFFLFFAVGRVW